MSAARQKEWAQLNGGMEGLRGYHAGSIPCYRDKKSHAKWRWGQKKGLRRARRRVDREVIEQEMP